VKVFHLNIGDPGMLYNEIVHDSQLLDVKTPPVMIDVLKNWTKEVIGYAPSQGLNSSR
jgi:hypothetical protein